MNEAVKLNREMLLFHLENNPDNRKKVTGMFTDTDGGRCALGLGGEVFGLDPDAGDFPDTLERKLGISAADLSSIFDLNDRDRMSTFRSIAGKLREKWGM